MNNPLAMAAVQKADYLLGPAFAREMRDHAARHSESTKQLQEMVAAGRRRQARELQHRVLTSYSSRLVCYVRSLEKEDSLTAGSIEQTAALLDPWHDPGEPIIAWAEPKSSGEGWRPICAFGPKRTALQTLCRDIITARFGCEPVDFIAKGKGADRASDHIVNLIEERGYRFFVVADIKEFFRSVQQGEVRKRLGLPGAVVQNCVIIPPDVSLTIKHLPPTLTVEAFDGAVRQGLPQGSRLSNLVAGLLLGPALRSIASADRVIAHGDDIAVAARSEEEAEALKDALFGMLASHPAGPFRLKRCEVVHVNEKLDFLKYRHRLDWYTGEVRRRRAPKSYWRYGQRVAKRVLEAPPADMLKEVARYRRKWVKAFPRWWPNWFSRLYLWFATREAIEKGMHRKAQHHDIGQPST